MRTPVEQHGNHRVAVTNLEGGEFKFTIDPEDAREIFAMGVLVSQKVNSASYVTINGQRVVLVRETTREHFLQRAREFAAQNPAWLDIPAGFKFWEIRLLENE